MQRRNVVLALGLAVLLMLFVAATGVLVWKITKRTVVKEIFTPQEKTVDITTVVTQVRELHRLETAAMRVVHVGTVSQTYKMVPNALGGDEITFLAAGDVIAGIDFAHLKPTDVWRSPDGTINLRLPPPQILITRVDNKASRVLTRKTGVLRRADVDLETRARQHAEINIRNEALKKGVLVLAKDSGERKMADFLRALGFEKVRIVESRFRSE